MTLVVPPDATTVCGAALTDTILTRGVPDTMTVAAREDARRSYRAVRTKRRTYDDALAFRPIVTWAENA
jgi:hypothetical protein